MPKSHAEKEAQKRYIEKNREKINAKMLERMKKQYAVKRDEILEYKKRYYLQKKAWEQLRNILIDDLPQ